MLRAHKKKTRRVSGSLGRSVSPRPNLRGQSELTLPQAPTLLKSTSVPSSLLDGPHNSGAIWNRQGRLPSALPSGEGNRVETEETVPRGGVSHSNPNISRPGQELGAGEETEPAKMGSLFSEWFQKLFAPNDGSAAETATGAEDGEKGGGSCMTSSAVNREISQAGSGDAPRNGASGLEKTSEERDVPSNKTSLATTDAARPPSPPSGSTVAAATYAHPGQPAPTKNDNTPVEKQGGSDLGQPVSSGVYPVGEERPPSAAAVASGPAVAGPTAAASSSGASFPSKPSVEAGGIVNTTATKSLGEVEQHPNNQPCSPGLISKGGIEKSDLDDTGGSAGAPEEIPAAAAVAAAAAEEASRAKTATEQAAAEGMGASSSGGAGDKDGGSETEFSGAFATEMAVATTVAAVKAKGTNTSPSSDLASPETASAEVAETADNARSGGSSGAKSSAESVEGYLGVDAGGKSDLARGEGGAGSGSTGSEERAGGGPGRLGPGSRSTSPSRSAALSMASDDGEEEHLYTAGDAQHGARPSIDDFSSLRVLGKGSYGKVVLVRRKNTGVLYAMKILKKGDVVRKRQVERTKIERRVLGNIEHPFLMRLHYAFQTENKLYLVLDYCPGGELFFHLSRYKRFPEGVVRFYAAELVLALKHLHDNKIIYRDIKPENILLDAEGHIKLGDFGLAKDDVSDSTFGAHSVCGTPEYMAPEVITKAGHGTAVDWWGLGMLMYEMLTGLPPWYTKDRQKLFERLRGAPLVIPKNASAPSASIISGLLTRNPAKRLGTLGALQVMNHDFFRGLDWAALLAKRIPAPLNPCRNQRHGSESTHNFDPQFTRMPIDTMSVGGPDVSPGPDGHFAGFTYEIPGVISDDDR